MSQPQTEITTYLDRITDLRNEAFKTLEGLSAEALDWKPLPTDTNSLYVLATHSIGSEHGWIGETIGGAPHTRNRPSEFTASSHGLDRLRQEYESVARESQGVLQGLDGQALSSTREGGSRGPVTVRWIVLHVLEHYSEHVGQMRLTRQLWENRKQLTT